MEAQRDALAWRSEHVTAAGVEIACFTTGSQQPDAPTVLLLHGLGHWTAAAWGRLVPYLDPAARIVGIDLPGFGASGRPDAAYDLPFFRSILAAVAAQVLPERFALVGHSLGGMLAADFAGAFPERITRLALIASAGFAMPPIAYLLGNPLAQPVFRLPPWRPFVRWSIYRAVRRGTAIDEANVTRAYALAQDPGVRRAFARIYRSGLMLLRDPDGLARHYARYTGPVFIAWGRHDAYMPIAALASARRVYPQAVVEVFEESGHVVMLDQPERLGPALRRFLA